MLSRRQFFSITIIMLVLLVLFQLTGVMKDYWNEYDKNEYAENISVGLNKKDEYVLNSGIEDISDNYAVLIGNSKDSSVGSMAEIWCRYTKRNFVEYDSLANADEAIIKAADMLLLDSQFLDFETDTESLIAYAKDGCSMVFCNLPDVSVISRNESLKKLLGIYRIYKDKVTVDGIEMYEGFLLGGWSIYKEEGKPKESLQDLELDMPWYGVYAHTKTYMVGMLPSDALGESKIVKNEDLPAVIWRNNVGSARIFVINGNYMEDLTALGILDACMYESSEYLIYPVVNAQNMVVADFAGLSSEYDHKMKYGYTRTQKAVFRDIVWPSLSSVYISSGDVPTFFINPKLDYNGEESWDSERLIYYMKLIKEAKAEAGMSLSQLSSLDVSQKVALDEAFYEEHIADYIFTSAFVRDTDTIEVEDLSDDIRTICTESDYTKAPLFYYDEDITLQRASVSGFEHTYSDNLRMKSIQTSLAYSNILVDLSIFMESEEKRDSWEHSSERLASNVITYWKPFSKFEKTVLTESDARVRQFLNVDYESQLTDDVIELDIENLENEAFFILRTHNQSVDYIEGGTYEKIEEHAYLISASMEHVEIGLKNDVETQYYLD